MEHMVDNAPLPPKDPYTSTWFMEMCEPILYASCNSINLIKYAHVLINIQQSDVLFLQSLFATEVV